MTPRLQWSNPIMMPKAHPQEMMNALRGQKIIGRLLCLGQMKLYGWKGIHQSTKSHTIILNKQIKLQNLNP